MTSMDRIAGLIEAGEIRTWADGFGVWHAKVKNTYAFPMGVARLAILHELQQRQGAPVPLPRVDVAERGETHDTYKESSEVVDGSEKLDLMQGEFAQTVCDTWTANLRNPDKPESPADVAISVDSIINNGIEETGNGALVDLTHEQLVALINRIHNYVSEVR